MAKKKLIDKLSFESLRFNDRQQVVISEDTTGQYFIKIEILNNKNKALDIKGEHKVVKKLNDLDCKTCPIVHEFGKINKSDLAVSSGQQIIDDSENQTFNYIIQDFIPSDEGATIGDMLLSIIEQKNLGVYQADIKPANVRFDSNKAICYIIDYDQATLLTEEQVQMDNKSFFEFCSAHDKERHGIGNWLRHFKDYTQEDVEKQLTSAGSLDLLNTTIFNEQKTTNSVTGIYHTISGKDIFIKGSRTLDMRAELLDTAEFKKGEKVLDVGCNAGLLSMYLHDRGCKVTGVDNDPHIVVASKITSNILGKDINYSHLDLDEEEELEDYDTIMLFSVFHHTRNLAENAKKVANSCSRIIIETRLIENGKQPSGNKWVSTSNWSFGSLDQLVSYCESSFEGFKLKTNLGQADKNRYILEFTK